jgi:hypothetical protein
MLDLQFEICDMQFEMEKDDGRGSSGEYSDRTRGIGTDDGL